LTEDQVYRLLDYLAELDLYRLSNFLSIVGIETLLMLGVRRSEACEITYEDIELTGDMWTVRIRGKGGRDRRLPLVAQLQERYEQWFRRLFDNECPAGTLQENPAGWIDFLKRRSKQPLLISTKVTDFSKELSDSELARLVRRHCLKAGIPFRVSPHMLRSTAITHALDQGATHRGVQQMAGWTSPLMISRYDKKRMDPKYSAVHNLQYANKRRKNISEASSNKVSDNLEACPPQHVSSPPA
jgi:integrase